MYHYGRGLEGFAPDPWTIGPLVVADGVLWVWALNVTRISVALLLLRLKDSLPWRVTLWGIIAVQACMLVVGTTMHLVMCRPISARWAPTPTATCIPPPNFMAYGYVYSGKLPPQLVDETFAGHSLLTPSRISQTKASQSRPTSSSRCSPSPLSAPSAVLCMKRSLSPASWGPEWAPQGSPSRACS